MIRPGSRCWIYLFDILRKINSAWWTILIGKADSDKPSLVWDKVNRTIIHALTGAPAHIKPADGSLIWYVLLSGGESIELRVYYNVAEKFFSSQYGADVIFFCFSTQATPIY